jgi:hypothetical protein
MTLSFFQQPQVTRSGSPEQPECDAKSKELDQWHIDDRKFLEAAISEGWPVPRRSARVANARSQRPCRTGAQTWLRRRIIKAQP